MHHSRFAGKRVVKTAVTTTCCCAPRLPLPRVAAFDSYLMRYPEGSEIPPHTDPVTAGKHYRLNIILKSSRAGGEFVCATPLFATKRIKLFSPDACEHSVTRIEGGSRYVLLAGWVRPAAT